MSQGTGEGKRAAARQSAAEQRAATRQAAEEKRAAVRQAREDKVEAKWAAEEQRAEERRVAVAVAGTPLGLVDGIWKREPPVGRQLWRPPWSLPRDVVPTDDLSQGELALEAQAVRPLLKQFGFRDSAVFHPHILNHQYLRTVQYMGGVPLRPYFVQLGMMAAISLFSAVLMYFGPQQDETGGLQASKGLYLIVGAVMGLIFGTGTGYTARASAQFWVAYAHARIAQKIREPGGGRRTVAVYELPLLRLAFVDRPSERFFSGVEQHSGFASGRMNLETDTDLSVVTDPRALYLAARPCLSSFTGVNTTRRHSLNAQAKKAGKMAAEKQMRREAGDGIQGWIGGNKGLTFFAISAAFAGFLMAIGVEISPSGLLG